MSAQRFQNNKEAQGLFLGALVTGIFKPAAAATKLGLASADFDDTDANLVFADITDASFVGYTPGGNLIATWAGPFIDPVSGRKYVSPTTPQIFTAGAVLGPQTIYGWYLNDGSGNLLDAGKFDVPIIIDTQFQTIQIYPLVFVSGPDGPDALED